MAEFYSGPQYLALEEKQIPEFMRKGAPEVFFYDPEIETKAELPQDPLVLYMMAFAIGYRQAIWDSRDADRREMLKEIDKLLEKHFRIERRGGDRSWPISTPAITATNSLYHPHR